MTYRTCIGCVAHGQPCPTRDALRKRLEGLGVRSIKWDCKDRLPRIKRGDPVWALTIIAEDDFDDEGQPFRDYFPGIAINQVGAKMLVYIEPGAAGRDIDNSVFKPKGNGFCKLPLSRIERRGGDSELVCPDCDLPTSKGHPDGYICATAGLRMKLAQ